MDKELQAMLDRSHYAFMAKMEMERKKYSASIPPMTLPLDVKINEDLFKKEKKEMGIFEKVNYKIKDYKKWKEIKLAVDGYVPEEGESEIEPGHKMVNKVDVETYSRDYWGLVGFTVEAGTTGSQGGDTGHGGRTVFSIKDCQSMDINVEVFKDKCDYCTGFEVSLGGDAEMDAAIAALEFILKVLKHQRGE